MAEYRKLYSEAGRIDHDDVLQSGICDYYAAVLVVNEKAGPAPPAAGAGG